MELDQHLLLDLIKEDRNEIRIIKNRIYTYMQALIVAAFALTAFFISRCTHEGTILLTNSIRAIICTANLGLWLLSCGVFWTLNKDLHFVRECLTWRQGQLKNSDSYFGKPGELKEVLSKRCLAFLNRWWYTDFKNDGLLFILMVALTIVYLGVMVGVFFI